jgi:hypothetical protein
LYQGDAESETVEASRALRQAMSSSGLRWWHLLLIGTGFFVIAIIAGPFADQHGYGTFASLMVALLALVAASAFWAVGLIRLGKLVISLRKSN